MIGKASTKIHFQKSSKKNEESLSNESHPNLVNFDIFIFIVSSKKRRAKLQ